MIELNAELVAEYLWQRELYGVAHMVIRRQGERGEAQGPEPTTYLGLAMAAPVERGHERPCITGASSTLMLPLRLPTNSPWASDPVGTEPPLGFSIDEVGAALGGAGGSHESMSGRVEIAAPAQVSGETSGER
jgi:hypothetical protein